VNFSSRLGELVKAKGEDQKVIAAGIGISEASLSNYLKGRTPKAEELMKIAKYFQCSVDFLLSGETPNYMLREGYREPCPDCAVNKALAARSAKRAVELEQRLAEMKKLLHKKITP
jgi:transcriptional regulator with XRE-family HTH domain